MESTRILDQRVLLVSRQVEKRVDCNGGNINELQSPTVRELFEPDPRRRSARNLAFCTYHDYNR